jgi:hypothetical protein
LTRIAPAMPGSLLQEPTNRSPPSRRRTCRSNNASTINAHTRTHSSPALGADFFWSIAEPGALL